LAYFFDFISVNISISRRKGHSKMEKGNDQEKFLRGPDNDALRPTLGDQERSDTVPFPLMPGQPYPSSLGGFGGIAQPFPSSFGFNPQDERDRKPPSVLGPQNTQRLPPFSGPFQPPGSNFGNPKFH
jgi:hypothetical protein